MPPEGRLRVIVVDDEPLARRRLCRLLEADPEVVVIGECADGKEAVQVLTASEADLVFLDVQMPEMDGFEVLRTMPAHRVPHVVFITAYDQYAIRAFEANAVDYLLKPFRRERFAQALERAKTRVASSHLARFRETLHRLEDQPRLAIRDGRNSVLLPHAGIAYIESANNYACVHFEAKTYIVRETLSSLERRLKQTALVRIHRSTIVNASYVEQIRPIGNGDHQVWLRGGGTLTLSRTYEERLPLLLTST